MAFRDFKVGTKQGIGFGIILVFMAGLGAFAVMQMDALRQEIDDFNRFWLARAVVSARLNVNASALRTVQVQHALATNQRQRQVYADSMNALIDEIYAGGDAYGELIEEVKESPLFSAEEEQLTAELEALWDQYLSQSLAFVDLRGDEAFDFLNGQMREVFNAFSIKLERLVSLNEASAADAAVRAEATYRKTRNHITILLVVIIVISVVMAGWLVQFITVPVRQLVRAARKVADGDFNVFLDIPSEDEIGKLARSFMRMAESLKAQQAELRSANTELTQQKAEIEQKNEDLEQAFHRLRNTQEQLVLKEKMASLGQLTAGIAHEIKNPLNFVNNFAVLSEELAEELAEELEANRDAPVSKVLGDVEDLLSDIRFNARKIHEHGRRADSIVRGMLEHSRGQSTERRPQELNMLVEEYVNLAYHGMRAGDPHFQATIERDYDEAAGAIELVPQEMGRVFLNLLNNAFYAVHEKRLMVNGTYEPTITVSTRAMGSCVEIRVQDNGHGIPDAIKARIFEPFFTTKPTGTGNTGLGLSLSYEIVTKGHGGTLSVESEEGEGTTFIISLPV